MDISNPAFTSWVFAKINGQLRYVWRAVDHEGKVLASYVTKSRDRKAALKFLRKSMKRHGNLDVIVIDMLRFYGAAMKVNSLAKDRQSPRSDTQPGIRCVLENPAKPFFWVQPGIRRFGVTRITSASDAIR